ncbi:Hypothetical predicted protein, partial [Drosophila guanche]
QNVSSCVLITKPLPLPSPCSCRRTTPFAKMLRNMRCGWGRGWRGCVCILFAIVIKNSNEAASSLSSRLSLCLPFLFDISLPSNKSCQALCRISAEQHTQLLFGFLLLTANGLFWFERASEGKRQNFLLLPNAKVVSLFLCRTLLSSIPKLKSSPIQTTRSIFSPADAFPSILHSPFCSLSFYPFQSCSVLLKNGRRVSAFQHLSLVVASLSHAPSQVSFGCLPLLLLVLLLVKSSSALFTSFSLSFCTGFDFVAVLTSNALDLATACRQPLHFLAPSLPPSPRRANIPPVARSNIFLRSFFSLSECYSCLLLLLLHRFGVGSMYNKSNGNCKLAKRKSES